MDMTNNSFQTSSLSATITGLRQRTEYGIQVRAKTQRGWGAYSPAIFKTTGQVLNTGNLFLSSSHAVSHDFDHTPICCSLHW